MNYKHVMSTFCAAVLCGSVCAAADSKAETEEKEEVDGGLSYELGEGISWGEQSLVSAEASLKFDSKYLYYGFVCNNDPILTPGANLTFFDWVNFNVAAIFDVTTYGRKKVDGEHIYSNRAGKYQELGPGVSLCHAFGPDDSDWLPTTVEFSLGWMYEYHPRHYSKGDIDTQFVTAEVALPDLWFEPAFLYERDVVRDEGTYLHLEVGHTIPLLDAAEEDADPLLALRPSVGQGFGNGQRVKGYATKDDGEPLDHAGLMDTMFKLELTWSVAKWVSVSGYVAYSDFLFDRSIRDASRSYEATGRWEDSFNFIGGLAVTASF